METFIPVIPHTGELKGRSRIGCNVAMRRAAESNLFVTGHGPFARLNHNYEAACTFRIEILNTAVYACVSSLKPMGLIVSVLTNTVVLTISALKTYGCLLQSETPVLQ